MNKACYIYTPSGFRNCNEKLEIRGNNSKGNTINGTPSNDSVPRVYAYTANGFEQIYPANATPSGKITINARKLNLYRYHTIAKSNCTAPGTYSKPKRDAGDSWGWRGDGRAGQGFFEQDYVNSGVQDMSYVHFEHYGWLDLGSYNRGKLPNANKVKSIKSLSFSMNRRSETGYWAKTLDIYFCLANIDNCGDYGNNNKAQNPYTNRVGSPVLAGKVSRGPGDKTIVVDVNSAQGKAICDLIMKWMKGEAQSVIMMNNETCKNFHKTSYVNCSDHYTRINTFSMSIDYMVEG